MCAIFFPRLSALCQRYICHCFLHVLNLSSDDLILTRGINLSVKFTELSEAAKDLPIAFYFTEERAFVKQRSKTRGFDLKLIGK